MRFVGIEIIDPTNEGIPSELAEWHPDGRLLRLSFSTKTNVREMTRKLGLNVHANAYFCENEAHELAQLHIVFDRDGALTYHAPPSSSPDGSELWFYVAERAAPERDVETGKFSIPGYDLGRTPQDVCVRLRGRNMALEGFSSNTVKIASEELSKVLTKGP